MVMYVGRLLVIGGEGPEVRGDGSFMAIVTVKMRLF